MKPSLALLKVSRGSVDGSAVFRLVDGHRTNMGMRYASSPPRKLTGAGEPCCLLGLVLVASAVLLILVATSFGRQPPLPSATRERAVHPPQLKSARERTSMCGHSLSPSCFFLSGSLALLGSRLAIR